jgi:2',3'-cyclic-nucleotide 2'-phosphodiesterase (5'-nucleotidase family)
MKFFRTAAAILFLSLSLVTPVNAAYSIIRILHINDLHGFVEPYVPYGSKDQQGGAAWLSAKVSALRKERPSLFLAAGDVIQGNNWTNLSRGRAAVELMNLMGLDAMVVGNHEFDFGLDVLKKRISEARFSVLGANVEGLDALRPYVIKEVGGVRVAVLGIVTDDTPVATHPKNVEGLAFRPPVETVTRYLPELRKQASLVVVLSHLGYAADRKLAEQVPGVDVIVGGHSHTRVDTPTRIGNTVIVQALEHGKTLGVLDITLSDGKVSSINGRLEDIRPDRGEPDPAVLSLVQKYRKEADAVLEGRAGETAVDLDGVNVRRRETNLGNLVADIMRDASGADAAIINGGGIRASIPKGTILVKNVYTVLPFDNYIVAIRLSGDRIRQALEHGVSGVETGSGSFPQVSGLSFIYDPAAPPGSRVREVLIGGMPLAADREYTVATNDFLAAGGDGYTAFGDAVRTSRDFSITGGVMKGEKLVYSDSGRWLRDVVIEWLRGKKRIEPGVDSRVREVR